MSWVRFTVVFFALFSTRCIPAGSVFDEIGEAVLQSWFLTADPSSCAVHRLHRGPHLITFVDETVRSAARSGDGGCQGVLRSAQEDLRALDLDQNLVVDDPFALVIWRYRFDAGGSLLSPLELSNNRRAPPDEDMIGAGVAGEELTGGLGAEVFPGARASRPGSSTSFRAADGAPEYFLVARAALFGSDYLVRPEGGSGGDGIEQEIGNLDLIGGWPSYRNVDAVGAVKAYLWHLLAFKYCSRTDALFRPRTFRLGTGLFPATGAGVLSSPTAGRAADDETRVLARSTSQERVCAMWGGAVRPDAAAGTWVMSWPSSKTGSAVVGVGAAAALPANGEAMCLILDENDAPPAPVSCSSAFTGFGDFAQLVASPIGNLRAQLMRVSSGLAWFGKNASRGSWGGGLLCG